MAEREGFELQPLQHAQQVTENPLLSIPRMPPSPPAIAPFAPSRILARCQSCSLRSKRSHFVAWLLEEFFWSLNGRSRRVAVVSGQLHPLEFSRRYRSRAGPITSDVPACECAHLLKINTAASITMNLGLLDSATHRHSFWASVLNGVEMEWKISAAQVSSSSQLGMPPAHLTIYLKHFCIVPRVNMSL